MKKDDQRQNIFVSRRNIDDLARAFAINDALLTMIVKAAEQFERESLAINPKTLITTIHIHRSKFSENFEVQNDQD